MAADPSTEASGETLGEAKWSAVKELARRFPGLTAEHVEFEVLEEPDEGIDARVRAVADVAAWESADVGDLDQAERVRELLERIVAALDLRASVDVEEDDEAIHGTLLGDELGLFIGKHGQTIDAVQHLADRVAFQAQERPRKRVVDRRRRLPRAPRRVRSSARPIARPTEALAYGRPVALDAMGAFERRIVHEYLRERGDVETYSEGEEPDRHLVVAPLPTSAAGPFHVKRLGRARRPVRASGRGRGSRLRALLEVVATDPEAPTTVRDPAEAVDAHLADSLVALELAGRSRGTVDRRPRRRRRIPRARRWRSRCLRRRWRWSRASARKCAFMTRAAEAAGLGNVEVVHARAEEWSEGLGVA